MDEEQSKAQSAEAQEEIPQDVEAAGDSAEHEESKGQRKGPRQNQDGRPQRTKQLITVDTVLDPIPPKSERLPRPDEDKLNRDIEALNNEISKLKGQRNAVF